jgi:glycosyltransferase involved in cell wall biosynthesis
MWTGQRPANRLTNREAAGRSAARSRRRPHATTLELVGQEPAPPVVSVVIPTLNEEQNIGWVLERLPVEVDEIVIVDGRSTDGTIDAVLAARPDARVILEPRPGKGAALRAGFDAAHGDYVVMLDADGSMDPGEITRFIAALRAGGEVVKGSRFMPGGGTTDMTAVRRAGNAGLLGLVNVLYGCRLTDLCYGFCAFRRAAIVKLALSSDGFEIETEITVRAVRARLRITEVPSFESPRRYGDSNLSAWRDGRRVLHTLLHERVGHTPGVRRHAGTEASAHATWSAMADEALAARAGDEAHS